MKQLINEYRNRIILMVDDDPDDFFLARDAFRINGLPGNFKLVSDGEELIEYLLRCSEFTEPENGLFPCLILLDLNMPRKNGWETLVEIKKDPDFRRIPVVIFTTSGDEEDILKSYALGASSFITKPATFDALVEVMEKLGKYWLQLVRLPGQSNRLS